MNRTSHEGGSNAYDIRRRHSHRGVWSHRLGSIAVIYVCDGVTTCTGSMIGVFEEEGEYEYASYHHGESGDEEHQLGSGVLYQPLDGETTSDGTTSSTVPLCEAVVQGPCARSVPDDHSPNVQSECNRTGQHCSGRRSGPRKTVEDKKASCSAIAASVEAPYIWDPATWVPAAVGIGLCQVF